MNAINDDAEKRKVKVGPSFFQYPLEHKADVI